MADATGSPQIATATPKSTDASGAVHATESPQVSDETLMQRYQKGDASAFAELLRRHRRGVFYFALRFLGQQAAAEDALQEVFLRVVKNAHRYERRAKFSTWLYTIARNHCVDALRKASYRRHPSLDAPVGGEEGGRSRVEMVAGDIPEPDRDAHNQRLRQAITAAVASLGDEQREVFLLREHGGLAFKQIAEITGVSENTVKSRMRYALEKLRDQLRTEGFHN